MNRRLVAIVGAGALALGIGAVGASSALANQTTQPVKGSAPASASATMKTPVKNSSTKMVTSGKKAATTKKAAVKSSTQAKKAPVKAAAQAKKGGVQSQAQQKKANGQAKATAAKRTITVRAGHRVRG
jgi:hypothetical protein